MIKRGSAKGRVCFPSDVNVVTLAAKELVTPIWKTIRAYASENQMLKDECAIDMDDGQGSYFPSPRAASPCTSRASFIRPRCQAPPLSWVRASDELRSALNLASPRSPALTQSRRETCHLIRVSTQADVLHRRD